uniref:Uncharacterized protein n=1 Tax=Leersia perrieri TaxID=77586 RepID=A0A0D9VEN2_9ORYZ
MTSIEVTVATPPDASVSAVIADVTRDVAAMAAGSIPAFPSSDASPTPVVVAAVAAASPNLDPSASASKEGKGKQSAGGEVAIEAADHSDSERTQSDEHLVWLIDSDPKQVVNADRVVDQARMDKLLRTLTESSKLAREVIQNSRMKDALLEKVSPLIENAEKTQEELTQLKSEVVGYKETNTQLMASLEALLGYNPLEAKKQVEEELQKLKEDHYKLQCLAREAIGEKHSLSKDLLKAAEAKRAAESKHSALAKEHEVLKESSAREVAALKARLAEVEENIEPLLDELYPASAGSNVENPENVLDLLQSAPDKLKDIILDSASIACGTAFAMLWSFYPK